MPTSGSRLLPFTIAAIASLLTLKGVSLATTILDQSKTSGASIASVQTGVPSSGRPAPSEATAPRSAQPVPERSIAPDAAGRAPARGDAGWQLLEAIRAEKASLDSRARTLAAREEALEATAEAVSARSAQAAAAQRAIAAETASQNDARAKSWAALVRVYEDMRPDDAAAIFNTLDIRTTVEILRLMKERKAAPILSGMNPDRARMATQMLASRLTLVDDATKTQLASGP